MDPQTAQLVVASVGVAGTLSAAGLAQLLSQRAERRRRAADDRARWLADRLRVNARYLAGSLSLERDLWSAAAQLDRDTRPVRMPGHNSILLTPEEGIPGVLDELTRAILVDAIEDAFKRLDQLEELAAEITLVGTPAEVDAAAALHDALANAVGSLERFDPFDKAADAVEEARAARDGFSQAARAGLQLGGAAPIDNRPRRLD